MPSPSVVCKLMLAPRLSSTFIISSRPVPLAAISRVTAMPASRSIPVASTCLPPSSHALTAATSPLPAASSTASGSTWE
eukprot:4495286-Prymnesium_polylepis.1